MASRPPTEPCVPVWYTAPPLFMPLQTCGSKNKRTGIQPSHAFGLRGLFASIGLDAIRQYPFLELARMPAFLLEIPGFSRFLHLVRTLFRFFQRFQNTMRIRLRIHSSMLWRYAPISAVNFEYRAPLARKTSPALTEI